MKLILKNQTANIANSPTCHITEYHFGCKTLDIAIAKISGRYPEKCQVVNRKCNEIAYVCDGNGKIWINGEEHLLGVGDAVFIAAGEKFHWDGEMQLFISCQPAWNIKQYEIVED